MLVPFFCPSRRSAISRIGFSAPATSTIVFPFVMLRCVGSILVLTLRRIRAGFPATTWNGGMSYHRALLVDYSERPCHNKISAVNKPL